MNLIAKALGYKSPSAEAQKAGELIFKDLMTGIDAGLLDDLNVSYEEAITLTIDCKVCGTTDKPNLRREYRDNGSHWYLDDDSVRRRSVGICASCDHWIELWQSRGNDNIVRVDGQHYMYGNHLQDARITQDTTLEMLAKSMPKKSGLGMGGSPIIIRFNDGRVVITNDLWHQGQIPTQFKNVMHDNAEMVRAQ